MNDPYILGLGIGTSMFGEGLVVTSLVKDVIADDDPNFLEYLTTLSIFASPVTSTYYAQNLDIDIKAKDSIAYIESMSREELVAFKKELSKIEKNIELEEQIDELLDESDSIRRI